MVNKLLQNINNNNNSSARARRAMTAASMPSVNDKWLGVLRGLATSASATPIIYGDYFSIKKDIFLAHLHYTHYHHNVNKLKHKKL